MKIYRLTFLALAAFIFAACQSAANNQPLSPTETMRASDDAAKRKDVEAIKKFVSKGTLEALDQSAKEQNTTVDELLKDFLDVPAQQLPEIRNEKITGDTATIEIKNNATNDWETMPFVKENGIWKVAYDKFEEAIRKRNEEISEMPAGNVPINNGNAPPAKQSNAAKK